MTGELRFVCINGHYLGTSNDVDVDEKFCPACGGEILSKCPNCGKPLKKNSWVLFQKYCTYCGKQYPWWEDGKMKAFLLSPDEEKLLLSNLGVKETLEKLRLLNDANSGKI